MAGNPYAAWGQQGGADSNYSGFQGNAYADWGQKTSDRIAQQQARQQAPIQQSRQQEQQQLKQQQKQSFLSKTLGFAKSTAANTGKAVRAVARPVADVGGAVAQEIQNKPVTNAGKFVHDSAQLASDVSGGTVNQFAKAVVNTPAAVGREVQNKPITDIQQKTFGTTDSGSIAKKIVASTAGTGATIYGGSVGKVFGQGAKATLRQLAVRGAQGAAIGGVGTAASVVNDNPSAPTKDVLKAAAKGAVIGGAIGAAAPVVSHVAHEAGDTASAAIGKNRTVNDLLSNTRNTRVLNAAEEANKPVNIPVTGESTTEAVPVKAPLHPPINEVKTADTVTVRTPQQMSDQEFTKQFNALSKNYEKDTKFLQQSSPNLAPKEVQALSDGLEAKHQGKLNDPIDAYNNPKLSEPVAPKPIKVAQDKIPTPKPSKSAVVNPAPERTVVDGAGNTVTESQLIDRFNELQAVPQAERSATQATQLDMTKNLMKKMGSGPEPVAPAETVKVPKEQLPVGTGQARVSRLEARMKGSMQNLTEEQRAGLSTYKQMNKQENISAAAMYVDRHPDEAMQVLRGEKAPPNGIAHNSVFLAMDAKGMDDPELARKLASLRSTRAGQEISLLTEANPHSPASAMSNLRNIRIEARGGEPKIRTQRSAIVKEITTNMPKVSKDDWSNFVESLRC